MSSKKNRPKPSVKTLRRKARAKQARRNARKEWNHYKRRLGASALLPALTPRPPAVPSNPLEALIQAAGVPEYGILPMALLSLAGRKSKPAKATHLLP